MARRVRLMGTGRETATWPSLILSGLIFATATGALWAFPALLFSGLGLRRGYHYRNPPRTKSDPIGRQRPMNPFV